MFDYVSTVISYSLIGVAVFFGKYDSLTPADLARVISQVSGSTHPEISLPLKLKSPSKLCQLCHQKLTLCIVLLSLPSCLKNSMTVYENSIGVILVHFLVQNSFFSLYLLNVFSTIVDTAVTFAEIAGFTHR